MTVSSLKVYTFKPAKKLFWGIFLLGRWEPSFIFGAMQYLLSVFYVPGTIASTYHSHANRMKQECAEYSHRQSGNLASTRHW